MSQTIHDYARKLAERVKRPGTILLMGEDYIRKPQFIINKSRIAVREGNTTFGIWSREEDSAPEDMAAAFKYLREEVHVFVEVK